MKRQTSWIVACCLLALLACGCVGTGSTFRNPLADKSIAKKAADDPFPEASEVGLAEK